MRAYPLLLQRRPAAATPSAAAVLLAASALLGCAGHAADSRAAAEATAGASTSFAGAPSASGGSGPSGGGADGATSSRGGEAATGGNGGTAADSGGSAGTSSVGGSSNAAGTSNTGGARARALFEPADGKTLLLVGQDSAEIESYAQAFGMPGGVMLYSNVWDGLGVLQASDFGGLGTSDAQRWAQHSEPFALQIGLDLDYGQNCSSCESCTRAGHLEALAAGTGPERATVEAIANMLHTLGRPTFLRVGYEFDAEICPGGFGKYPMQPFRQAFQRVVEIVRQRASNVAVVWSPWAFQSRDPASRAGVAPWGWYPGDELVDWVGLSVFPGISAGDPTEAQQADKRRQLADFAEQHGKPLMVSESAPRARFAPLQGDASWSGWFAPLFDYVATRNVKALSYINMNWEALPAWAGHGWGDTRLQGSPLEARWREQIGGSRFLTASPSLYRELAFQ